MQGSSTQFTAVLFLYGVCAVFQSYQCFLVTFAILMLCPCLQAVAITCLPTATLLAYACKKCQPCIWRLHQSNRPQPSSNLCTAHHCHACIQIEPSEYRMAFRHIQPQLWCRRLSRGLEGMMVPRHRGPAQLPPAVEWTGTASRLRTRRWCIRSLNCPCATPSHYHCIAEEHLH